MQRISLFVLASILLLSTACGQMQPQQPEIFYSAFAEEETASAGLPKVVMHPITDPQTGQVSELIPLPDYWDLGTEAWTWGTKASARSFRGQTFTERQGIASIDQVLQQYVIPMGARNGIQVGTITDLPTVAKNDRALIEQYWEYIPTRKTVLAKAVEGTDQQGRKTLAVVHFTLRQSSYGYVSSYYLHTLDADPEHYEQARHDLLFALANYRVNPQRIASFNRAEQQKAQVRQSNWKAQMASRWRTFNALQKTQADLSSINDSYFETWKKNSAIKDRMHTSTVNMIRELETVANPFDQSSIEVKSGYKYYFTNAQGAYIGTNSEFYDPAQDPRVNHQDWRQAPIRH